MVANRFRALLGDRNMLWLSQETGIAPSTLSDYMHGSLPRVDKAITICRALGTSVEWLFAGVDGPAEQGE